MKMKNKAEARNERLGSGRGKGRGKYNRVVGRRPPGPADHSVRGDQVHQEFPPTPEHCPRSGNKEDAAVFTMSSFCQVISNNGKKWQEI